MTTFAITATSNSVHLDEKRHGETTYAVFNATGAPIRGRADLKADNPAAQGWVSLVGDAQRDFPIAGASSYTVQITVPDDAPQGSYSFHLDMVGVERPEEYFTSGQVVTFVVPAPVVKTKKFPWWILAVAGGVVVIAVIVLILLGNPPTTVSQAADSDRFFDPAGTLFIVGTEPDFGHGTTLTLERASELPSGSKIFRPHGSGMVAIHFDLSGIPASASIQKAELTLFIEGGDTDGLNLTVQRALAAWTEDISSAEPAISTNDTIQVPISLAPGKFKVDVTNLVKELVANPSQDFGFALQLNDVGTRTFTSREGVTNQQPTLTVTYKK